MTQQAVGVAVGTDIQEYTPPIVADTEPEWALAQLREVNLTYLLHELAGDYQAAEIPLGSNMWGAYVRAFRAQWQRSVAEAVEIARPVVLSVPIMVPVSTSGQLLPRHTAQETETRWQRLTRERLQWYAALAAGVSTEAATDLDSRLEKHGRYVDAAIAVGLSGEAETDTDTSLEKRGADSATVLGGDSAEAATDPDSRLEKRRADLLSYLESVLADAVEEVFEAGMESDFSRKLRTAELACGELAIDALARVMRNEATKTEVKAEAVHQLGLIADRQSHRSRLEMVMRNLASPDARLRDSASVALAAMDDPAAIEAVRHAIAQEPSPALRRDLQLVLNQLEETQKCASSG